MPYRRTESVSRKLAARHAAVICAAGDLAAESGMAAVQIATVARRAGIAAGTIYRYFPSKTELVAAVAAAAAETEIAALRLGSDAAPGPLSALAAAVMVFAARALANRRMAAALLTEPVEPEIDAARRRYRGDLVGEFERRIAAAIAGGHLPAQDVALSAAALVGILTESLLGPFTPDTTADAALRRTQVQTAALFALRALGVVDARARGLIVQTPVPPEVTAQSGQAQ
jgi:AcrR family transcriptional regulator